jgi:hypothetical protein
MSNLRGINRNLMESQQQRQTLQARIFVYGFHLNRYYYLKSFK